MNYKVFLDNVLDPSEVLHRMSESSYIHKYKDNDWIIARSYEDFIDVIAKNYLEKKTLEFVSFGHDLSKHDSTKNGLDCAAWLSAFSADFNQVFPTYEIHSSNPVGKKEIGKYIKRFCDNYYCEPQ